METDKVELKTCPFCGSTPYVGSMEITFLEKRDVWTVIECPNEDCLVVSASDETVDKTIELWNKRV